MNTQRELLEKIESLEIEKWVNKARADAWKEAFQILVINGKSTKLKSFERAITPFTVKEAIEQETKAEDFVNNKLDVLFQGNPPPKEGEIKPQGVWLAWAGRILWEAVREEALAFIAKTLEGLKEKAAEWAANLAKYLLEEFQSFLYEKFQASHSEEEQEHFKKKIIDNFPDSGLAKKLFIQ